MNLFGLFGDRNRTSSTAKERLQILLAHDRSSSSANPDLVSKLQQDILELVARHMTVGQDNVRVTLDSTGNVALLEIDIDIDFGTMHRAVAA